MRPRNEDIAGGQVVTGNGAGSTRHIGAGRGSTEAGGRTVLPLGNYDTAANIPGRRAMEPVSYPAGLPGARVGQ